MHNAGKVTQASRYRQSLILYARKYGVTKAAIRYSSKPAVHLPLDKTLRRNASFFGGSFAPPSQSSQTTQPRQDETHQEYAAKESQRGAGGVLGEATGTGVYTQHCRAVPFPAEKWADGKKIAQSKVRSQALRADEIPGSARPDRRQVPQACLVGDAVHDAKENGGYY